MVPSALVASGGRHRGPARGVGHGQPGTWLLDHNQPTAQFFGRGQPEHHSPGYLAGGEPHLSVGHSDLSVGDTDVPVGHSDVPVRDADLSVGHSDLSVGDTDVPVGHSDVPVGDADLSVGDADVSVREPHAVTASIRDRSGVAAGDLV